MAYTTTAVGVVKTGSNLNMGDMVDKLGLTGTLVGQGYNMGNLYRGGSYVQDCKNNQYVPSSGTIAFSQLQGACRYIRCTVTTTHDKLDVSSVWSHSNSVWNGSSYVSGPWNEWGEYVDKYLELNADVYSSNSTSAMTIPSGHGGTAIFLKMNGYGIYGYRGSGGGQASRGQDGFTAIYTQSSLAIDGTGYLYGGGGGGGGGGRGGREGNDGRNNRNYCCGWFCPQCSSCDRGVGGGGDGGGSGGSGGAGAWYSAGRQGGQGGNNPGNGGGGGGSGGPGGNLGQGGSGGNGGNPGNTGPGGNCQGGGGGEGGQGGGGGSNGGYYLIGSQYTTIASNVTKGGRIGNS